MFYAHTIWITLANCALGVLVLLCVVVFAVALGRDIAARVRKHSPSTEMDRELLHLFGISPLRATRRFHRKH